MSRAIIVFVLLLTAELAAWVPGQSGPWTVRVEVPPAVLFQVNDVSALTTATPVRVSFNQAVLATGQVLRISVKADGDLVAAAGFPIAATDVAWTTSGAVNGVGINGTLSKTTHTPVFEGRDGAKAGRVDLTFTLTPAGTTPAAGTWQTSLRWKFEAITP
jgi:hypothetical protein